MPARALSPICCWTSALFPPLAIRNRVAVNVHVCMYSRYMFSSLLGVYVRAESLALCKSTFNSLRSHQTFPHFFFFFKTIDYRNPGHLPAVGLSCFLILFCLCVGAPGDDGCTFSLSGCRLEAGEPRGHGVMYGSVRSLS